jgi:hypothetical protein
MSSQVAWLRVLSDSPFSGNDSELGAAFDDEASRLVRLVFDEASLR